MTIKNNKKKNTFLNNIDLNDLSLPYTKELEKILNSYSFDDIDVLKQEDYNNELLFKNDNNVK